LQVLRETNRSAFSTTITDDKLRSIIALLRNNEYCLDQARRDGMDENLYSVVIGALKTDLLKSNSEESLRQLKQKAEDLMEQKRQSIEGTAATAAVVNGTNKTTMKKDMNMKLPSTVEDLEQLCVVSDKLRFQKKENEKLRSDLKQLMQVATASLHGEEIQEDGLEEELKLKADKNVAILPAAATTEEETIESMSITAGDMDETMMNELSEGLTHESFFLTDNETSSSSPPSPSSSSSPEMLERDVAQNDVKSEKELPLQTPLDAFNQLSLETKLARKEFEASRRAFRNKIQKLSLLEPSIVASGEDIEDKMDLFAEALYPLVLAKASSSEYTESREKFSVLRDCANMDTPHEWYA
jgi:hypothetical protein